MKLELGAGNRPTPGYWHNDTHHFPHIEVVGDPWMIELADNSVSEVLALAFMEHLTYDHALDTLRNVHRLLEPGGCFLFDVPDYPVWARYYLDALDGKHTPIPMEHIRKTLFGWQRWPGDEHLYGWDRDLLSAAVHDCGYAEIRWGLAPFLERKLYRRRFKDKADAHLYVCAVKDSDAD